MGFSQKHLSSYHFILRRSGQNTYFAFFDTPKPLIQRPRTHTLSRTRSSSASRPASSRRTRTQSSPPEIHRAESPVPTTNPPRHRTGRSPETGCAPSSFGASFRSIHDSRVTGTTFPLGPNTPDIPLNTAAATPRIAATNPHNHHCRTFIPATLQLPSRPVKSNSFPKTSPIFLPRRSRVCPESAHDKSVNPGIMPRGSAGSPAAASLLRHHAGGFRPTSRRKPRSVRPA